MCVVHTIYRQTLYILCVGTGFTVLLCAGAVRRAGTQHVWSASRRMRKVENISFKDFIMQIWIGTVYMCFVLCEPVLCVWCAV